MTAADRRRIRPSPKTEKAMGFAANALLSIGDARESLKSASRTISRRSQDRFARASLRAVDASLLLAYHRLTSLLSKDE